MIASIFGKRLIACTMLVLGTGTTATAAPADQPAPVLTSAYREHGGLTLNYDDYDYILSNIVMSVGRSDHEAAPKPDAELGSRFIADNPDPSRLEGNRVMFHVLKARHKAMIDDVRDAYLDLPRRVPLDRLSRNEQLAYWFNLHNIIVLAEVADRYPTTDISRLWSDDCAKEQAFSCERRFKLGGTQMISLNDIQHHVLTHWRDPLVIYGFYMGAVGTPNIRPRAYRGDEVWPALRDNAVEFINSVRGTRMQGSHKLRVSTFYRRMAAEFPQFDTDLMKHLRTYASSDFREKLEKVSRIKVSIDDWHIADLYNGHLTSINDIQNADGSRHYPPQVVRLLTGILERNRQRHGTVDVEEVLDAPATQKTTDDDIAVKPDPKR